MRVTLGQLHSIIGELHAAQPTRRVRGVRVREVLHARYGARAGTDRIYRAIHEHHDAQLARGTRLDSEPATPLASDERQELLSLIEQTKRELANETAQSTYYALELDKLRQETKYALSMREHGKLLDANLDLHRENKQLKDEIGELQALLQRNNIALPARGSGDGAD